MQRYWSITSRTLSSSKGSLLILFLIETVYLWLVLKGRIVVFFDTTFPINPILTLTRYLYYWNIPTFPGGESYIGSYYYMLGIASFFQLFGLGTGILQYISILITTFISSSGFYLLVRYLLDGLSDKKIRISLSALVSAIFYSLSPFYTLDFVSNLSGYIYSYAFYPLLLYLAVKYITNRSKLSLNLLYFTIIAVLFSFGNPLGAPPTLWWELVIGVTFLVGLYISKVYKIYLVNLGIAFVILIISFAPFISSYLGIVHSLGYEVAHTTFLGKSLLENAVIGTFPVMSLHNFGYLYYILDYSFSLYKGLETYLLTIPTITILGLILLVKDKKVLKFSVIFLILMFIVIGGAAGVYNPLIIYNIFPSSITAGIAYSFQAIFSLYPISFVLTLLAGISFFYALSEIKWKVLFGGLLTFTILFIIVSVILLPPMNVYSNFGYSNTTSLTPVIFPLRDLSNFLVSHEGWYNVLISPSQWPGYAYNDSAIIPSATTFGQMILPPDKELVGGLGGLVDPILVHFPSSGYNFTNFFLLLGIKYVIINIHAYPGPGIVLQPQFANGFGSSGFNVTGMEYVLNQEGAKLVANYSLFLIYQISSDAKMIYASNGIPFNFSQPHVNEIIFSLYANNTYKVYNVSLVSSNISINDLKPGDVNITYKYVNPDCYAVYVNASKDFYLIFDQGYSASWVLKFSNGTINNNHYFANGYANAWLMPKGLYKVKIYYSPPDPYFQYMKEIYIPLLLAVGILVLFRNRKSISEKIKIKKFF